MREILENVVFNLSNPILTHLSQSAGIDSCQSLCNINYVNQGRIVITFLDTNLVDFLIVSLNI